MGKGTQIEWADDTVNAEMGCDGCELWDPKRSIRICYAGRQTERMLLRGPRDGWPPAFEHPTIFPGRIAEAARWKDLTGITRPEKPWLNGLPRVIFLNDMGDTFTASLPLDWLAAELPTMAASPHLWLILTKRADRLRQFSLRHELPPNVWAGVSVTSAQDQRLRYLMETRAAVRFISYEPVLGPVDLSPYVGELNWVILGGESGPEYQPMELSWLRSVVEQWRAAGVRVFVKQDSGRRPGQQGRIPDDLWIKEFPVVGMAVPAAAAAADHPEEEATKMIFTQHPVAALLPRLTSEDYADLKEDIRANGIRVPILIHKGQVLDGWHRYQIASELGIACPTVAWDGKGTEWLAAKSLNLIRRHLSAEQRAAIYKQAEKTLPELQDAVEAMREEAKQAQVGGGKQGGRGRKKTLRSHERKESRETTTRRAALAGVSRATLQRLDGLDREDPEAVKRVADGTVLRKARQTPRESIGSFEPCSYEQDLRRQIREWAENFLAAYPNRYRKTVEILDRAVREERRMLLLREREAKKGARGGAA